MLKLIYCFIIASIIILDGISAMAESIDSTKQKNQEYFKTRDEYRNFQKKLLARHYKYRIKGEIVDPNGNIVADVSVLSSKSRGPMSDSFDRETFLIKDGKFDFTSRGVFSWGLTFEKTQYYKKIIGMGMTNVITSLDSGEAVLEGNVIVKKIKVVLFPWGDFGKELLSVNHNVFTYFEEGVEKKITGLVVPYEGEGKRIRKDEEFKFSFKNEKELPKNLIYIAPGRNKDGNLDGTIRLKTNAGDGGFFPVKYEGTHCFRRMWEAPADGYQPELIIKEKFSDFLQHNDTKTPHREASAVTVLNKAKQENDASKEASYIVFYFRTMGYYGKGLIMPKDSDSKLEKDKASLRIYLYVNRKQNERNTNKWLGTNW